jgi:agarase
MVWLMAAQAGMAAPAVVTTDDFSTYPAGAAPDAGWDTDGVSWWVQDGKLMARPAGGEFAVNTHSGRARQQQIEVTLSIAKAQGTDWKVAGAALYDDDKNYWHLALCESPDPENRHFVELQESYDGQWLAVGSGKTRLTPLAATGSDFDWQYDHPYRLKIVVTTHDITGTDAEMDGQVRANLGYRFDAPAVMQGAAALHCSNFQCSFSQFRAFVTEPAPARPAAPAIKYPPFTAAGLPTIHEKATGFFRVQQINGKWWLITPKGEGFFACGTDHANYNVHFCQALGYAPYHRNCVALYGSEDAWAKSTAARLKSWNFNALGVGWSQGMQYRGFPRDEFISFGSNFSSVDGITEKTTWTGFPDVFSPRWPTFCNHLAKKLCAPLKGDPWVIGYFLDNELEWFGKDGKPYGLFDECMRKPADHPAKQALIAFLKEGYPTVSALNAAWKTSFANWDALAPAQEPGDPATASANQDRLDFVKLIADRYFSVTAAAIRKWDPNHLNLGCRFAGQAPPGALEAAGRYCDVVSVNFYGNVDLETGVSTNMPPTYTTYFGECHRPMMITEWSFPAYDSGLPCLHGAGQRVATQAERARCYEVYQSALAHLSFMVGSNYFMWADEPALGISKSFPEDSNYGLVDVHDHPWAALVAAATKTNARIYAIHSGMTPEIATSVDASGKAITIRNTGGVAASFDLQMWVDGAERTVHRKVPAHTARTWPVALPAGSGGHIVAAVADPNDTLPEVDRSDDTSVRLVFHAERSAAAVPKGIVRIPLVVSNPSARAIPAIYVTMATSSLNGLPSPGTADIEVIKDLAGHPTPFQVDGSGPDRDICLSTGALGPYTCRSLIIVARAAGNGVAVVPRQATPGIQVEAGQDALKLTTGALQVEHLSSGGDLLSSVSVGGTPLGVFQALMHQELAQQLWVAPDHSVSTKVYSGPVRTALDIAVSCTSGGQGTKTTAGPEGYATQSSRPYRFTTCYRLAFYPGQTWFTSRLLWVENMDTEPWKLAGYYHYAISAIGGTAGHDQPAHSMPPSVVAWQNPDVKAYYGCVRLAPDDFKMSYWTDPAPATGEHPDVWRDVEVLLKPGQTYAALQPRVVVFGCAGSSDAVQALAKNATSSLLVQCQVFAPEK